MARGLDSFDAFEWASLLTGRDVLVCDGNARRAMKTATALEAAGARATIADTQFAGRDRMLRRRFWLAVLALEGDAALDEILLAQFCSADTKLLVMVDPGRRERFRAEIAEMELEAGSADRQRTFDVKIVDLDIKERDLVLSITGNAED